MTVATQNPHAAQEPMRPPGAASRFSDTGAVRLCAGLALLLVLAVWFDLSGIVHRLFSIDSGFVLLAICLFVLQFALSCLRWLRITGRQHARLGPRAALSIYGAGTLANLFLVTSVAGMSVRAALLVRAGTGLPGALASVTAERIAAMAGLALCGFAGLVFALPQLDGLMGAWSWPQAAGLAAAALAAAALAGGLACRRFAALRTFVQTVWTAFASLRQAALLIGVSAGIMLSGFAGMAALAAGMGLAIDPLFFFSVMPAVAFVSALPISVGGWGVREGAMVAGLSMFSVAPDAAMALSISYGLGGLLVALLLGTALALLGQRKA